jgi:glutaryl-CoA dehydrogenase
MKGNSSHYTDPYLLSEWLTEEEGLIRDSINALVAKELNPIVEELAQAATFPKSLFQTFGGAGLLGPFVPEAYGGSALSYTAYGIMMQELEACDSGFRSACSVQGSLVMYPILKYGSEAQKLKWLPKLASGENIGCFGLTEPNHGSNPAGMETNIKDMGSHFLLNGAKMWITNSPIADVAVVWARNEAGRIKGVLVEKGMKGFTAPEIKEKWSLRASITGELVFDSVEIPKENILPEADGLSAPLSCLDSARYGIAWGVIGAARTCFETAVQYSLERQQFGSPIAAFQLTQKKLAEMQTELVKAQLLVMRLAQLKEKGQARTAQISLAKRNNVAMALHIARESRQILGAMGITGQYPIMRHMMNLESVVTYEGTHDIHLLITGHDITGIQAFRPE